MALPEPFRRRCRQMRTVTTLAMAGMAVVLVWPYVLQLIAVAAAPDHVSRQVLLGLVWGAPGLCFLAALASVRHMFAELATGQLFQPAVIRALRRVGIAVITGALLQVFVVTNLTRWVVDGRGGYALFDPSSIVLGIVGAALVVLARVMEQARAMQAELDGMI